MDNNLLQIARVEDVERIFDELSDSVVIIHPITNNIIYFNRSTHRLLGYSKDEFSTLGDVFFTTYNSREAIRKTVEKVILGERISFISKHIRKNGSIQYADLTLSRIVVQDSPYICAIWQDVTENLYNQKNLGDKNNRLKRFLEILTSLNNSQEFSSSDIKGYSQLVAPLISNGLDIDRVSIRLYNDDKDILESITIYDRNVPDKIKGKTLIKKEYSEFFEYLESNPRIVINDVSQSKTLKEMIKVFFSEDGMINSLLATRIKVNSEIAGFIFLQSKTKVAWEKEYELFASQIADQMGMMIITKELKTQQLVLENKVQERTKTLQIAKNIAENATLSKTRFLSNMSHELRTPLNAIIGFLSLIDKEGIQNKNRFFIEQIQEGSDNLLQIINDVLDLSKIEAGKMETQLNWLNLKKIYYQNFNFYKQLFTKKNLEFNYQFTCRQGFHYTDSKLLRMIVNNLLSNALKFTSSGAVDFILRENIISETESQIILQVKDTGIGIKESNFSKIFRSFEQIEQVNSKEYQGTGLGLVITKRIVQQLQGTVSFESTFKKGTTFTVVIPMKYQGSEDEKTDVVIDERTIEIYDFTDKNILIVDDNPLNQGLMSEIFKMTKANIDITENGLEAIKKIETNAYDLILMDIEMPIMDGLKASQLIRLNPKMKNVPIFAVSASSVYDFTDRQMSTIFNQYIMKPYTPKDLLEKCFVVLMKNDMIETNEVINKPFLNFLDEFTGISTKEGLKYVSHNELLLQTVIQEIVRNHANDFHKIMDLYYKKDMKSINMMLHSLKGFVKTIGMKDLYSDITTLEKKISIQDDTINYLDEIRVVKEKYEKDVYIIKYIDRMVNRNGEDSNGI